MDLKVANQSGTTAATILRDYRKGNWNVQETMILIEAKKMDDERRMKRLGETSGGGGDRGKPAELRWKWVEDYCWRKGCLRSQNQCNDKWDNLMRDFKKVREYERREAEAEGGSRGAGAGDGKSYWRIEKNERKDKNLPSNMLPQVYEALVAAVDRKCQRPQPMPPLAAVVTEKDPGRALGGQIPAVQQYSVGFQSRFSGPLSAAEVHGSGGGAPSSQPLPTATVPVDSDTSEYSGSPLKGRKRPGSAGEGPSGGSLQELGSAISKSASAIAEAIHRSEEREERRHGDMLNLHEKRLRTEESKAEVNREGINGLVDAINNLANSIFALAAHNAAAQSPPKK